MSAAFVRCGMNFIIKKAEKDIAELKITSSVVSFFVFFLIVISVCADF